MDRLLLLRLRTQGCAAELRLNDIPLLAAGPGRTLNLPVNEYLFEGRNRMTLLIEPPAPGALPPPRLADGDSGASARLLLPRIGRVGSEHSARSLAELDWAAADGEWVEPGTRLDQVLALPVKFPRWRWPDMPAVADPAAVQPLVARFVQGLALSLARGDPEPFVQSARLRFEELAQAYAQPLPELLARWRARIQRLHAAKALRLAVPALADVMLRPCGDGRLLECLAPDGAPLLRSAPADDGSQQAWPLRVAVIDGHCHVLR